MALYLTKDGILWWRVPQMQQSSAMATHYYNIYASRQYPVDTSNPENLVAVRISQEQLQVPKDMYYAVCAVDRYGQESTPRQLADKRQKSRESHLDIEKTDGHWLYLPVKGQTLDAEYVLIETLQGQQLITMPYRGSRINISRLPDGIYVLRSLGRKGVTHRIGQFAIKRGEK
jgi:hypothetical protein